MTKQKLLLLMKKIRLQILILQLQLRIKLLREKLTVPNLDSPQRILLHHAAGYLDFGGVNAYHKYKWGFKSSLGYFIGYQYFIERDGSVHQGRADNEEGAHTRGHNKRTIGICLMGDGTREPFTPAQMTAMANLVEQKRREYNIPKNEIYPHSKFTATLCPSDRIRDWLKYYQRNT